MKTERQSTPRLPFAALLAGAAFIAGTIACSMPASLINSSARSLCVQEQSGSLTGSSLRVACSGKEEATQELATRMSFFQRLAARALPKHGAQ